MWPQSTSLTGFVKPSVRVDTIVRFILYFVIIVDKSMKMCYILMRLGGIIMCKKRCLLPILFFASVLLFAQEGGGRGSIPEELLRPSRVESPRFPIDLVIGELGQGRASFAAYSFARSIASALLSGRMDHPALADINPFMREAHLTALSQIESESFRIGSGRQEPDGAVSFLVRFIGRDEAISAEMYLRHEEQRAAAEDAVPVRVWVLEDLILEQARRRGVEEERARLRSDFFPHERFF